MLERHLQTILSSVVVLMLAWSAARLIDMGERQGRIEVTLLQLVEQSRLAREQDREFEKRLQQLELQLSRGNGKPGS